MQSEASRSLKWLYCLTLMAVLFPVGLSGAKGWVGLAAGGGLFSGGFIAVLLLLAIVVYRIVLVARNPHTLNAYIASTRIKLLRYFGILLMAIGLIGSVTLFFIKPIALGFYGKPGDAGVAFFVVGMFAYLISSSGLIGLLMFEASRLFGFESRCEEEQPKLQTPAQIASTLNIKQPGSAAQ